jgi:hypothetical protein
MSRTPAVAAPAAPVPAPVSAPVSGIAGKREMITGLLWDVGGSVATYYVLHALGFGDWVALLAAAAFAGGRIVWVAVRDRDLNAFASIMLLVWAAGLLLSFLSGDARFLLAKESATTLVVGLAFLASIAAGRPLTLAALKSWNPARAADLDRQFATVPAARRAFFVTSAVWGGGLVADALVRIPLIYALPVDVMVGLSTAIMVAAFVLLGAWNGWYIARVQRRSQAA